MILEWLWAVIVLIGTTYLVFWVGISGWWYLLSCYLMTFTLSKKKVEIED